MEPRNCFPMGITSVRGQPFSVIPWGQHRIPRRMSIERCSQRNCCCAGSIQRPRAQRGQTQAEIVKRVLQVSGCGCVVSLHKVLFLCRSSEAHFNLRKAFSNNSVVPRISAVLWCVSSEYY